MTPAPTRGRSTMLDAARSYARRGIASTPLDGKRPILRDWPTADAPEESWASATGVGLVLGARSGGLVDVDYDCDEVAHIVDQYFPASSTFGRGGKERHWLGRLEEGEGRTRKFRDPVGGTMLVELRCDGAQTMAPPSMHPSGVRVEWMRRASLAVLPYAQMVERVGWMAAEILESRQFGEMPRIVVDTCARWRAGAEDEQHVSVPSSPVIADASIVDRASKYLASMPPAISGSGGQAALWAVALAMVRGFALHPDAALDLIAREWNPRCQPVWSMRELRHSIANATRARSDVGYLATAERR